MGVDISSNPYHITGTISSSTKITDDLVYVQKVVWYSASTAGHKAMLRDKDDHVLFPFIADAPGTSGYLMYTYDFSARPHPCNGLYCDDLDSGELLIFVASSPSIM